MIDHVTVTTRVFRGNQTVGVVAATVGGLLPMSVAIAAGAHPFLSMACLIGGIVAVLGVVAGDATVRLDASGLHRSWLPLAARWLGLRPTEHQLPWTAITALRFDHERSRSGQRIEFVVVELDRPPHRILVTDRQDAAGFAEFAATLRAWQEDPALRHAVSGESVPAPLLRRSFYKTLWGRSLTLLFLLAAGLLGLALVEGTLSAGNALRVGLVIVPGTAWMVWRSFLHRG